MPSYSKNEVLARKNQIVVKKAAKQKFNLSEMVSRMPPDYEVREESFGPPVGKEEWQLKRYVPDRGDFIALTFDPQSGHQQRAEGPPSSLVITSSTKAPGHTIQARRVATK
jgi:hypothetical protein